MSTAALRTIGRLGAYQFQVRPPRSIACTQVNLLRDVAGRTLGARFPFGCVVRLDLVVPHGDQGFAPADDVYGPHALTAIPAISRLISRCRARMFARLDFSRNSTVASAIRAAAR